LIQIGVLLIAFLIVIGSFFVLAIQLFVTLIEFKLTTLAGFVLVPFGLFGRTAFLAERALGNVIASGVKILVLAVIIGIGTNLFSQVIQAPQWLGNQPTLQEVMAMVLASLTLLGLGIYGPGIATGLTAGAPQLGAGAAVGTVSAAWGTARATSAAVMAIRSRGDRSGASFVAGSTGSDGNSNPPEGGSSPGGGGSSPPDGSSSPSGSGPPPWAQKMAEQMQRRQTISRGFGAAGQALRSGDRGGAPTSVNLKGGDR
jgi:type IV secretion system protein TrbL